MLLNALIVERHADLREEMIESNGFLARDLNGGENCLMRS